MPDKIIWKPSAIHGERVDFMDWISVAGKHWFTRMLKAEIYNRVADNFTTCQPPARARQAPDYWIELTLRYLSTIRHLYNVQWQPDTVPLLLLKVPKVGLRRKRELNVSDFRSSTRSSSHRSYDDSLLSNSDVNQCPGNSPFTGWIFRATLNHSTPQQGRKFVLLRSKTSLGLHIRGRLPEFTGEPGSVYMCSKMDRFPTIGGIRFPFWQRNRETTLFHDTVMTVSSWISVCVYDTHAENSCFYWEVVDSRILHDHPVCPFPFSELADLGFFQVGHTNGVWRNILESAESCKNIVTF